jgi:hypothetical protein
MGDRNGQETTPPDAAQAFSAERVLFNHKLVQLTAKIRYRIVALHEPR